MLDKIRIQNFRSIIDAEIALDPLTVLIGCSGTGKSNFVKAIRFLRNLLKMRNTHSAISQSGHSNSIIPFGVSGTILTAFTIHFRVSDGRKFMYHIAMNASNSHVIVEERLEVDNRIIFHRNERQWIVNPNIVPLPPLEHVVPTLGSLTGSRESTLAFVTLTSGIGCYDFPGNVLVNGQKNNNSDDGYDDTGSDYLSCAASIVSNHERFSDWDQIVESTKTLSGSIASIEVTQPRNESIMVGHQLDGKVYLLPITQESEGIRRYFAHMLAVYQSPPKQTIILEHPELGIHPGALRSLFDEFVNHVGRGRGQIILVTHSPDLLDYFSVDQIRAVSLGAGGTKIGGLAKDQAESLRKKLLQPGELLTVDPARIQ